MKPKTKRKLNWKPIIFESKCMDYLISECTGGGWFAKHQCEFLNEETVSKSKAIQLCERHAREKGRK